jgi:hypothetical protein
VLMYRSVRCVCVFVRARARFLCASARVCVCVCARARLLACIPLATPRHTHTCPPPPAKDCSSTTLELFQCSADHLFQVSSSARMRQRMQRMCGSVCSAWPPLSSLTKEPAPRLANHVALPHALQSM